ncbi:helix-turn-helix transcriptional regulator [Microbacterium sp. GXF7504]
MDTGGTKALDELRRAVAGGNPATIAETVLANVWPLFSMHYEELVAAVVALPPTVLQRHPVLRVLHPMTPVLARTGRPFKPLVGPELARTLTADELDMLTLVQMVAFRLSGDVAAAHIYARRLQDRIHQIRAESRDRLDGPLWYYHHQIGSTLLLAGDTTGALLEFGTARQLARLAPQPDAERVALGRTALAHALRGSLEEAEAVLDETLLLPAPTAAHALSCAATERTTAALIAVEQLADDVDARLAALEPYDSVQLTWPFALLARTRAHLARHRPDEALEAVRLASGAHPDRHGSVGSAVIAAATIEALWEAGDTTAATAEAAAIRRPGAITAISVARVALQRRDLETATRCIQQLTADSSLGPGQRAELQLLTLWLEASRSDEIGPHRAEQVARLATRPGNRRMLSTLPVDLVGQVRAHLPADDAVGFEEAVRGLVFAQPHLRPQLTDGELRVLAALPHHPTTAAIAGAFHISPNTVKSHLKSLYRKLGCSSRDEAVALALRLHLLPPEPDLEGVRGHGR